MTLVVDTPARFAPRGRTVRWRRWSTRVDTRSCAISGLLVLAIVVVGCWSISVGDFPVPIRDVVKTLLGNGTAKTDFIVNTLRLPRIITGALVGAAFGIAGAIFQSLAQNPLASPDVVGFNFGAALGAVFTIVIVDGATTLEVSLGAMAGGFATALLVLFLAYKRGVQGYRLILVGIGVAFTVAAATNFLLTRANILDVQRAAVWITGSLNGRGWDHVRPIGVGLLVLAPIAMVLARQLRMLELGDDTATALGISVSKARLGLVVVGVALAGLATGSAGPIAFVALISPPIARRMVRSAGACLIPAALVGALLTTGADLVARRILAPIELPVGIATGILGAPYLLWLLTREIRTGAM